MHLYMMTRGVKHGVDQFITQLQGKYLPFKWRMNKETGKLDHKGEMIENGHTQLQVRPIQLWEIVFPEEHKDIVLNTILAEKQGTDQTQHKKHNKFLWAIRKALGCEPIGEYKTDVKMPIAGDFIERIGIGIKKDYWICPDGSKSPVKVEGSFEGI